MYTRAGTGIKIILAFPIVLLYNGIMKNNYQQNKGSISHATMRSEDLIPTFLFCLEQMKPLHREHRILVKEIKQRMAETDGYFDSEDSDWDLESLFNALDSYAPKNHYFGAHPGDGADYGFWECEEA